MTGPTPATDLPDPLRAALSDRYRIAGELGRGGMATVYLADDLKHERPVAIKVLHPALASLGYEPARFLREIRIASRLSHPQILPLHDSGEHRGVLYYVMPYMGPETLRSRMQRDGALAIDEALRIGRAVAAALDYAHRQGVVHRDIKPENILLPDGQPVVADFGVARAMSVAGADVVTERGVAVGTPAYMSPEQASGDQELDGRSDIYSLACVIYEMLAGEPPFSGPNARAIMARQATSVARPIRTLRPEVAPAVEKALARALAKDPAQRFPTAAAFAEALAAEGGRESSAVPRQSLAVLPFLNGSADPDAEYFSDGITEELINALSRVEGLRLASRASVFALKGKSQDIRATGAALDVDAVLEGTVRRAGARIRVTVQLSDATDGGLLWSERFDREMRDIFAIQDEITLAIVGALRARFLRPLGDPAPHPGTRNLRAYQLYLRGRFFWNQRNREGIADALHAFEQAIGEDPGYALAYTGLADAYALQVDYRGVPVGEFMERAKLHARKALELDESLAEAHTSLAWVTFIYDWDWERARYHFTRAIELNPQYASAHQWYAWLLMSQGHTEEAIASGRRGMELDPASVSVRRGVGWLYFYARQPLEALPVLERALVMNPTSDETLWVLGLAYMQAGRMADAHRTLSEAVTMARETTYAQAVLGVVAIRMGRRDEAIAILRELETAARVHYVSPSTFAILQTGLGNVEEALAALEAARAERRGLLCYINVNPLFDPLRGQPRFEHLIDLMQLPHRSGALEGA